MADAYLYIHQPTAIFKARVNMPGTITYPITSLIFDGVTLGAFGDVFFDMTILLGSADGLDDLGRTRVQNNATSTTIPLMRTSQGVEDGELTIVDNAYITVLDDFRVWSKIPRIDDDGIQYKDTVVPVGTFTAGDEPPIANCGPGFAGFTSAGIITVQFVGTNSITIADGATISTYNWDVDDGTITVGTSASSTITATFPAGFRWVVLTVEDSNGNQHTSRCPVLAVNAAADTTIRDFTAEASISARGQEFTFNIKQNIPQTTYPDGALILFWEGAAASASDRSHMKLIGWHQRDDADVRAGRLGIVRGTAFHAVDVAGRLASLPGFPQSLERNATPDNWDKMVDPTMRKYIHYLIQWHSTAVSLADVFLPTYLETDYPFVIFASEGESLYDQVENEAKAIVPTHHLTCNQQGQLSVVVDPMIQAVVSRTSTVQAAFTEEYLEALRFSYTRPPKVHWLRGHALLTATGYTDVDGVDTLLTVHCIAPGEAPGQGLNERETNEGLAISQTALNTAKGHEYARLNARYGRITAIPADDDPYINVEPADMTWVTLTITSATAAQRGLTFSTVRCLVHEIRRRWEARRTGALRKSEFTLEVETSGVGAVTTIPEGSPPPAEFVPPLPNDPEYYYDDINAYVLWDGATVYRTWNLQAAPPVWEEIGASLSGVVYDVQYMHVDALTVGAWCMTSTGIYFCPNIMAAAVAGSVTWTQVLTIATARANTTPPAVGLVIFASMAHYWLQPGHLCIAFDLDTENDDYLHSFYAVTEDYGDSWTYVDESSPTYESDGAVRSYYTTGRYGLAAFRSEPILWCVRGNGRTGTNNGQGAVFRSDDGGLSWDIQYVVTPTGRTLNGAILHPFPDIGDPSYMNVGVGGTSPVSKLYLSENAWTPSGSLLTPPSGHANGFGIQNQNLRPNKDPFVDGHVLMIFKLDASSNGDLYDSTDKGTTWNLLEGLNNSTNVPNGWPPDNQQWVLVDNEPRATNQVRLTLDYFSTFADKTGNLVADFSWTQGNLSGGFALPKIAPNI